jgi:hypothetical protein
MIPSSVPPFFQIHKSHGIGYGMNSVGAAASKKLGVINNAVSVPLSFDVNRYFKPLWKPGHLLDTNLKSCGFCLRPTRRSSCEQS